ncbi:MAG TPA: YbhB/YbcL family Raf kinase inhibitor-like protein [Polyangiaceae bacterium]|nr:YbhB/YbcL family Raf kinase inhibitor-like protein [Polyangiaceae bacterium]
MIIIDRALPVLALQAFQPWRASESLLAEAALVTPSALRVTSPAFGEGRPLPSKYASAGGQNVSPPLAWSGVPAATRELALICEDADAPLSLCPFVHWTMYRISPSLRALPEAAALGGGPAGAVQGTNSLHKDGYVGPAPPRGRGRHHYHFQLFALGAPLDLGPRADRDALVGAMRWRVLAMGELVGTYERA